MTIVDSSKKSADYKSEKLRSDGKNKEGTLFFKKTKNSVPREIRTRELLLAKRHSNH